MTDATHAQSPRASVETGFAWVRLIGSLIVVADHCAPLTDRTNLTIFPDSWNLSPGYVALLGFFAMSGYQISDSWARDPVWWRYVAKRALRLLPPLLVVVVVAALVIGPLVTTLPVGAYLSSGETWTYITHNAGVFVNQYTLPGVFERNPDPGVVNGSLWTLPMEVGGYVLVLVLAPLIALSRVRAWTIAALLVLVALDRRLGASFADHGHGGSFLTVPLGSTASFLVPFALGMVLHAYRDRIVLSPLLAWSLVGLQVAVHTTPAGPLVLPFAAGYGAVVLAHHWPSRLLRYDRWVYGSYGLYVWGCPMQQLLVLGGLRNRWALMAAALPVAYLCGLLSWRWIEAPTQALRHHLHPRRGPAAAARADDAATGTHDRPVVSPGLDGAMNSS